MSSGDECDFGDGFVSNLGDFSGSAGVGLGGMDCWLDSGDEVAKSDNSICAPLSMVAALAGMVIEGSDKVIWVGSVSLALVGLLGLR